MLGVSKGAVSNRLKKDPHLNALKTALSKGKASSKSLHRPKWPEFMSFFKLRPTDVKPLAYVNHSASTTSHKNLDLIHHKNLILLIHCI